MSNEGGPMGSGGGGRGEQSRAVILRACKTKNERKHSKLEIDGTNSAFTVKATS